MLETLEENREWLDRLWRILQSIEHPSSEDRRIAQSYLKMLGSSRELYLVWNNKLSTKELFILGGAIAQRTLSLSRKYSELNPNDKLHLKDFCERILNEKIIEAEELEGKIIKQNFHNSNDLINFNTSNQTKSNMRINQSQKEVLFNVFDIEYADRITASSGEKNPYNLNDVSWIWKSLNGLSPATPDQIDEYKKKFPWFEGYDINGKRIGTSTKFQSTPVVLEKSTKKLDDHYYDPKMFEPILVDETIDKFFSNKGGVMPATVTIIVGDPGIGKTTLWMEALAKVQTNYADKKVLFVSAEMDEIDLKEYVDRIPTIGNIDIFFIGQWIDKSPKERLEKLLEHGYDLILIDSFAEVLELVKSEYHMSSSAAESWLLNSMIKVKGGENERKVYSAFLVIQQVNKGGNFVGSNKLKHNTTAMLDMRWDGQERYMEFVKNRRGAVNQRLYFDLTDKGTKYDGSRLEQSKKITDMLGKNTKDFASRQHDFDKIFGTGDTNNELQEALEELDNQDEDEMDSED